MHQLGEAEARKEQTGGSSPPSVGATDASAAENHEVQTRLISLAADRPEIGRRMAMPEHNDLEGIIRMAKYIMNPECRGPVERFQFV